MEETICRKANS